MKKVLLASLCLSIGFLSNAQISKGSVLLGGDITFNSHIDEGDREKVKSTGIWITPSVGMAVKDNTVLGLQLGYTRSDFTSGQSYSTESHKYRSGIFLRKYFSLAERFYAFGGGGIYFDILNEETNGGSSKTETKGWGIGLEVQPGVAFAFSKRVQLELGFKMARIDFSKSNSESVGQNGEINKYEHRDLNFTSNFGSVDAGFRVVF